MTQCAKALHSQEIAVVVVLLMSCYSPFWCLFVARMYHPSWAFEIGAL
jgi:hypothetical protein